MPDAHRGREVTRSGLGTCQRNPLGGGRDDQSRYTTSGHARLPLRPWEMLPFSPKIRRHHEPWPVQIWTFSDVILRGFQQGHHRARPDPNHYPLPRLNSGVRLHVRHPVRARHLCMDGTASATCIRVAAIMMSPVKRSPSKGKTCGYDGDSDPGSRCIKARAQRVSA